MKKKKDFNPYLDFSALAIFSLLMSVLVLIAFYLQANPDWKKYQKEFQILLKENISPETASAFDFSVKQIWLPELNRVDRCVSCHLGYDNPILTEAPEPFKTHPNIEPHSVAKMGCTICHGGQGFALQKNDAHGEIEHWEKPLLGRMLAEKYGFKMENVLIQIKCNICHRGNEATQGTEMINLAKKLITQKRKCQTCHIINSKGGTLGPDLTFIGDKPAERFDFSNISTKLIENGRPLSMLSWHFEHFMNPKAVIPNSKMPLVNYSEEEAWSLAMLMMSWKNTILPIALIPKENREDLSLEDIETGDREVFSVVEWGEKLFESKSCSGCHTIGGDAEDAPDLKGITKIRDIKWLRSMILFPEEMEQNDPIAIQLYQEYDEMGMVSDELSDEEAEAIIKYIDSFDPNEDYVPQ